MAENLARRELCKMFLDILQEGEIPWESAIMDGRTNSNYNTGYVFTGLNEMILNTVRFQRDYTSTQWLLGSEIREKGYHLKETAEPVYLELHLKANSEDLTEEISMAQYAAKCLADITNSWRYIDIYKTYMVYNISDVLELEPKESPERTKNKFDSKFIQRLSTNMGVKVTHDLDKIEKVFPDLEVPENPTAFYIHNKNVLYIQTRSEFDSVYDYYAVLLHELCHATGDATRLDRTALRAGDSGFGSKNYAKEELRAEIGSAFLTGDVGLKASNKNKQKHKQYVKSWLEVLQKNPEELYSALDDAYKIEEYILKLGKA